MKEDLNNRFHDLLRNLRRAQQMFFRERSSSNLHQSRALERQTDQSIIWAKKNSGLVNKMTVDAAESMLKAQREYYKNKHQGTLRAAKAKESKLDVIIANYFSNQTQMFDDV